MEHSLRVWMDEAFRRFSDINDLDLTLDSEKISSIAKYVFSAAENFTEDQLLENISKFTDFHIICLPSDILIIEALLICAVSPKCPHRAEFVQQIMEMDQSIQVFLMEAIKNNFQKTPSSTKKIDDK